MESNEILESRLSSIEQGAVAFKVLAGTFALLGVVLGFVVVLTLTELFQADLALSELSQKAIPPLLNCVACFMLFWFLRRAGLLFWTVADLIREMREVV
jgi:hypothetical protein